MLPHAVDSAVSHPVIRVLAVAAVRLYREGLATNLACRPTLKVVGTAASLDEAMMLVASELPDVVVLDMATRDSLDIVRAITSSAPAVRIIAFAVEESDSEILACAEAGVAGYVYYEASADDLMAAIESVVRGELLCRPRIAALLLRRLTALAKDAPTASDGLTLTGRERQIVLLIQQGLSNKEIAQRLKIEVATVKNHVHNLLEKLHVSTRAQAAAQVRSEPSVRARAVAAGRLNSVSNL